MTKHFIVQISDTHLFGDKNRKINGSNSYLNLKNVLKHILSSKEKLDLIILTGDISQDCTFESYQNVANLLNKTGIKYYLLPGNHDDVDVINKVFDFNWVKDKVDYSFEHNGWLIYVVDTSHYPLDAGKLTKDQLLNFKDKVNQHKSTPSLIFMHHHPVLINSSWMDNMILKDAREFNNIVKENSQIKAVLFGHIHQVFEKNVNGIFYVSAPSTSFQVLPNCEMFALEKLTPGYRLIELDKDKFSSKIVWVE